MKQLIGLLTLLLSFCAAEAKNLNVLFVGNSYTYVHDMPEILKAMAEDKGHKLTYKMQAPGGSNFQKHWERKTAVQMMKRTPFDVVVLQDQSFEPVGDPDRMMKYGNMLATAATETGARLVYYQTMAYKAPLDWMKKDSDSARYCEEIFPNMQARLVEAYDRLAKETGGKVAPVGAAWQLSYETMPELRLHAGDNSHPQKEGAYLTALVFFATLFEEEPVDMPRKIEIAVGKKEPYEIRIDAKARRNLETAAQQACL